MRIRRQSLYCALVIVAAIWTIFGVSIGFGTVDLDDQEHILANPMVANPHLEGLISIWKEPYFKLYIPMTYTAWAGISTLTEALSRNVKVPPFALFHGANVLCHTVSALAIFAIFRRRNQTYLGSCLGALFFALHPLQVESVAWISGFKDTFSGMLSILAIYFLLKYRDSDTLRNFFWSMGLYVAAIFAKPTAVIIPMLALAFVYFDGTKSYARKFGATLALQIFLGSLVVIYAMTIQPAEDLPFKVKFWERPLIAADALLFYVAKIVAPFDLGFDYGMDPAWVLGNHPVRLALVIVVGFSILFTVRPSWRFVRSPAGLFFLGLLPTLGLISYYYQAISTTADRYVYLAMVGPAYLLALILTELRGKVWSSASRGFFVCLLFVYGLLSLEQVWKWQTTRLIAEHTLGVNSRSWLAHHILGGALIKSGDLTKGQAHLKHTIAMRPWFPDAYYNLGIVAKMTGDLEGAVTNFKATVRYEPKDGRAWYELGATLATLGRYDQASDAFERSLVLIPTSYELLGEFGRLKVSQGDPTSGVALLERAVAQGAKSPQIYASWGEGLLRLGRDQESLVTFSKALGLGYREATMLTNYGLVNLRLGRLDEAIKALEEGVALDPQGVIGFYNLGLAYEKKGERERARLVLKKAIELRSDFTPAQKALTRLGSF